jgi:hypothetical protein
MQRQLTMSRSRGPRREGRKLGLGGRDRKNALSPPEFVPTMSLGHKFRFSSVTQTFTSLPITRAMLLNLYTLADTTTLQWRVITAIKLNRIRMWCQPPALGSAPSTCVVEWKGLNSPSTIHSDTAIGVRPAFVSSRPPPDSSNRWWSISASNESEVLVNLSGAAGTVIDVDCSVRFADDEGAVNGESGTGAAATAGQAYWNYLDGFASKILTPVGGVRVLP